MDKKMIKRNILGLILVLALVLPLPMTAFGDRVICFPSTSYREKLTYIPADQVSFDYVNVEDTSIYLAPGIKETKSISLEKGTKQHVDYTCEIDLSSGTTEFLVGYKPNELLPLSEQINMVEAETGKNVVAGVNANFFSMAGGFPLGLVVSDGKVLNEARVEGDIYHFYGGIFAVTNEGEAKIIDAVDLCYDFETSTYTPVKDGAFQFAVAGDLTILKNDKVTKEASVFQHEIPGDARGVAHARTAVGIKDDGTVVLYTTNGKIAPFNYGYTAQQLALIMKAKGCHTALLLDGGGSSTYSSQHPGEASDVTRTLSSDCTERHVSVSILVATTASKDGVFTKADAKALQKPLSNCQRQGHEYMLKGDNVRCAECGKTVSTKTFSGLVKDSATGRTQYLYQGKARTGYVPFGMDDMYYFDSKGLSCDVKVAEDVPISCTAKGYRVYQCNKAPANQKQYKVSYPKATGHDYEISGGCRNCGWKQVKLEECDIKIGTAGYTGKEKYPTITVKTPDGTKLKKKSSGLVGDYKRSFSNNVEIGTAKVTLEPIVYYVNQTRDLGSVIGQRTVEFQILPYPAKKVQASSISHNGMLLKWKASESAGMDYDITYDVYQKTADGWKKLANTRDTQYQVTGLSKCTSYEFGILATTVGKDGETYDSWEKATVKIKTLGLDAPKVKASNVEKTGKITLTWNAVAGADQYKVYRSKKQNGTYSYIGTTKKYQFVDAKASVGKSYYYKVKAIDKDNSKLNSSYSKVAKGTCKLALPKVKVSTDKKTGKPKISWNKVSGSKSYKVYRSAKKNGTYKMVKTVKGTSYIDKTGVKGKNYYYKVKAI